MARGSITACIIMCAVVSLRSYLGANKVFPAVLHQQCCMEVGHGHTQEDHQPHGECMLRTMVCK